MSLVVDVVLKVRLGGERTTADFADVLGVAVAFAVGFVRIHTVP